MCRLLALRADEPIELGAWLPLFAEACRTSKEYQGHGWGVAWRENGGWRRYRSVRPIWEDAAPSLPRSTVFVVHARSAFRNEGIVVENNMPFLGDDLAFAFNGELRGVRLSAPGATGAAKLMHLLERFRGVPDADPGAALTRLADVVRRRTEYVRALNVVAGLGEDVWLHNEYSEDPEYFTLHEARTTMEAVAMDVACSEALEGPGETLAWRPLGNGTTRLLGGEVA